MNPIRHAVPKVIVTARSRETRLAQAAILLVASLAGAVSCSDTSVTEPLVQFQIPSGVAPDSLKRRPQQAAGAAAPLASMSAAASAAPPAYSVSSIPFAPEPGPFTTGLGNGSGDENDDATFGGPSGFDLGFDFTFFGTTHAKFWVASNGAILFQAAPWGACCYRWIPSEDDVNNMIALALTDLRPEDGQVSYAVRGTAPSRRLIVNFDNVPVYSGMGSVTTQAILYEGSNVIEVHTTSQDAVQEYTQGVENATGSHAEFLPARVLSLYSLSNDAVRFTPLVQNNPPTADAGGTAGTSPKYYEGTEGVAIHFVGSGADADNDQITYAWDFDDDGIVDAETPEADFTFPDNREYNATLTVQDSHGATGQASVWVKVRNTAPVVSIGDDVRINAGDSVSFSGRFSDKGVSDDPWGWTYNLFSLGSQFGTTRSQGDPLASGKRFCKAGSFPVKLTVTDKNGDWGSDELVVTVDAISIQIEIKPNNIVVNDKEKGKVTVEVFSRSGFDATALNPSSLRLTNGSGRGTPVAKSKEGEWKWKTDDDRNRDGLLDGVAEFERDDMLANGDLQLETTKLTFKGQVGQCGEVAGSAEVRVKVKAKDKSAGSSLQPSGAAATPLAPSDP
jgi:PKD domain-containing protein